MQVSLIAHLFQLSIKYALYLKGPFLKEMCVYTRFEAKFFSEPDSDSYKNLSKKWLIPDSSNILKGFFLN